MLMKNNIAAVILAAGKGSRMNDNSTNKVCFNCAGIPVIRRILDEMRAGGVSLFVIVIGHMAQDVMDCLDGEPGVIYAYQKEQKGTGHAVLCGMNALKSAGYNGPVIVSMGDKIVASHVVTRPGSRTRAIRFSVSVPTTGNSPAVSTGRRAKLSGSRFSGGPARNRGRLLSRTGEEPETVFRATAIYEGSAGNHTYLDLRGCYALDVTLAGPDDAPELALLERRSWSDAFEGEHPARYCLWRDLLDGQDSQGEK